MANPNNSVGTNGAFGGRTSVNAFNDVLASFSGAGIVSGWAVAPSSGMMIKLGGSSSVRDVAIAQDNIGNRTTLNNILGSPVEIEIPTAPTVNNRADLIVGYVENPPQGTSTEIDNPGACSIIVVSSAVASNPTAPTDSDIRSAITADGASGANAYYVILARVYVRSGLTTITSSDIFAGDVASVSKIKIDDSSISQSMLDWSQFPVGIRNYSISPGNSNWSATARTKTFTVTQLSTLGIVVGDWVKVHVSNKYYNNQYNCTRQIEISGAEFTCQYLFTTGTKMLEFEQIVQVTSSGITVTFISDDYTQESCRGNITIQKVGSGISI